MAVNRFSLYQMEQFKKERNKKLMESATKAVEECGFSSKQIKKMMKKKGREKEEEETKECGCGPMKKGKKLSKKEKAPGMRPEPKDKAVVHNMESDGVQKVKKATISESRKSQKKGLQTKDVMRLKKEQKKMLKLRGNTKDKVSESELEESKKSYDDIEIQKNRLLSRAYKKGKKTGNSWAARDASFKILGAADSAKEKRGLDTLAGYPSKKVNTAMINQRRKERLKKVGMPGVKGQKNYKAKESDTPLKATKVVISESKKSFNDIKRQAYRLQKRAKKQFNSGIKAGDKAKADAAVNRSYKIGSAANSAADKRNLTELIGNAKSVSARKKAFGTKVGMPGVENQNKYRATKKK